MSLRVVRLGSPRMPEEGPRLGTVRRPELVRPVVPQPGAQRGNRETRASGQDAVRMGALQAALPERNGHSRKCAHYRVAGAPVAQRQFLGGLLLRRRKPLPPLGAARAAARMRRPPRVSDPRHARTFDLLPPVRLPSAGRRPLVLYPQLRDGLAHFLDSRRVPRLRLPLGENAVPRLRRTVAAPCLVPPTRSPARRTHPQPSGGKRLIAMRSHQISGDNRAVERGRIRR